MKRSGLRNLPTAIAVVAVLGAAAAIARGPFGAEVAGGIAPTSLPSADPMRPASPLPASLVETGLYADFVSRTIAPEARPFSPQYPLWTDGATKRRWIRLPKGAAIDASASDAWQFPVGTKLWKEFSFGRPVETRFIERTSAGWRFAAYVWSADGTTATLAPERGTGAGEVAPGVPHRVPAAADCRVCHGAGASPVLGFGALQLSADRDPLAPHRERLPDGAIDLAALIAERRLVGYTGSTSPRMAARTPTERAALGYLHANCGTCHRGDGALASLGMVLASSTMPTDEVPMPLETTVERPSRFDPARMRVARGRPDRSLIVERMRSRSAVTQMPPLGTQLVDDEGVRLMTRWIEELPKPEGQTESRIVNKKGEP